VAVEQQRRRWRRLDPDARFGLRLTLALVAVSLLAVPFLLLLLLVLAKSAPLLRLDTMVATDLHRVARQRHWLVHSLTAVSTVFDPRVFRLVTSAIAVWLWVIGRRRLALWAAATIWGAALLGVAVKSGVGRSRPSFADAVAVAPGRSFPSGHALGSVVGCGVLLLILLPLIPRAWRWVAGVTAMLIVAVVGLARVGLGVHYLSDVAAGWLLGLGWLAATVSVFETWRREVGARPVPPKEGLEPELASGRGVRRDRRG